MPMWLDATQESDAERGQVRWRAYQAYLRSISNYLPDLTKQFALSEWYWDRSNFDRCPHDAWLESIEVCEPFSGDRKRERTIRIKLRLLASSHRGHILFEYEDVVGYQVGVPFLQMAQNTKHGDWLADEITLASNNQLVHEILFSSGAAWKIQCGSISYTYVPLGR